VQQTQEKRRIMVATPVITPEVSSFYVDGILDMYMRPPAHTSFKRLACFPRDIVRARSRLLRQFLDDKECTHVLYVDGDNVPSVDALRGMLEAKVDVIACPYPRREFHPALRPHETAQGNLNSCIRYSVLKHPGAKYDSRKGIVQINGIGFGFTLITRRAAEKLVEDHRWKVSAEAVAAIKATVPNDPDPNDPQGPGLRDEILSQLSNTFEDDFPGNDGKETVAVFSLVNTKGDKLLKLLGEDYSFCARCQDSGIPIYMYVGKGSPVEHDGMVRFTGNVDDILKCAVELDQ
jgi:hypothetical protein